MNDTFWLIPLFPAIGFLIIGFLGTRLPRSLVHLVACGSVFASFIFAVFGFNQLLGLPEEARFVERELYTWLGMGGLDIPVGFRLDPLSAVMILVVSGVGFLIHVYSVGYMHDDPGYARYFAYLNLFTFMMLILVLANNFVLMFLGWEGVGLCSYLLIGFWYEKKSAADAGKKAFVVNRVGDFGFLIAIFLIFVHFDSELRFARVFELLAADPPSAAVLTAIALLLFVGAMGKSAQIPLYVWLPDAMEGPTPVSALIHAATMVTSGVYMVARCSAIYTASTTALLVVAVVGAATALFAATIGLCQKDIKRVLAYSTVSQLGYMFLALGVGAYAAGIFHLTTHAFFKALLFLGSGSVIHAMAGEQNMEKMGGLRSHMPVTFWTMLIATLAIAGIIPFSGFFSKDEILWSAFSTGIHGRGFAWLLWGIGAAAAAMTAFYMFRLMFLTFWGEGRSEQARDHAHESPKSMTVPLMVLAVLSAVGGFMGVPAVLKGSNRFAKWLEPVVGGHGASHGASHAAAQDTGFGVAHASEATHEAAGGIWMPGHAWEIGLMIFSVLVAIGGILVARHLYRVRKELPERLAQKVPRLYDLIYNKYYVDELYDHTILRPIVRGSIWLWKIFDTYVVDGAVNALAFIVELASILFKRFQTGHVRNYALYVLIGAVVIIGIVVTV